MSEALLDVGTIVDEIDHQQPCAAEPKSKKVKKEQGRALNFNDPAPSPLPQNGVMLLDDISRQVRRFLVADQTSIDAIALWIVFAHIAQKAFICPNLCFNSATKACGKSTALDIVSRLVPKAIPTSNITPAALFRAIEAFTPTLVIDEADSMFRNNDDLRTIMNAGFNRLTAFATRLVGDEFEPRQFNVYCPKVIALIGNLPDTLESRSVIVRMRRRKPDEEIERLRGDIDQGFSDLKARILRFALDHSDAILAINPETPPALSDRQADCWRELLRIADSVGGDWPARARAAALELCSKEDDSGDLSIKLLVDIQKIFAEEPERTKWPSQTLVDALNAMEESPWPSFTRGKGLTTNRLARMLVKFDVRTKTLRDGVDTPKGYSAESFNDAFARYLPHNRNTATNDYNDIHHNELKCCGNVFVADAKRNIPDENNQDSEGAQSDELDIF